MNDNKALRSSIMEMAGGAFLERVDYEMNRVLDNIFDVNTRATAKRKINVTIELTPDDSRSTIAVAVHAKSALTPTSPCVTSLYVTKANGQMMIAEMVPQIPGQIDFAGNEQEPPKILKLAQNAK